MYEALTVVAVFAIAIWFIRSLFSNRMDELRKAQEEELDAYLEAQRVKRQIDAEVDNDRLHSQRVRDKYKDESNS